MRSIIIFIILAGSPCLLAAQKKVRPFADTVGFAHTSVQVDSLLARTYRLYGDTMAARKRAAGITGKTRWRVAISPHDDHTYASYLYPLTLDNINARTIILFGVTHRAKQFGIEDKLIFDSFTHWSGAKGEIEVSGLRDDLLRTLPHDSYLIHDSLQQAEHSVEGILPFLQQKNDIQIVSILVPPMNFATMEERSHALAKALSHLLKKNNLTWGEDVAIVISNDAVHYGDTDWGGRDFAFYGADSVGYLEAIQHEKKIITLLLDLNKENIRSFHEYTVKKEDHRQYKWTWCGRYSVPVGLLTSLYLNELQEGRPLRSALLDYATTIDHTPVPVTDLGMGVTAPANIRHWVGFLGIGYE